MYPHVIVWQGCSLARFCDFIMFRNGCSNTETHVSALFTQDSQQSHGVHRVSDVNSLRCALGKKNTTVSSIYGYFQ